MNNIFVVGNVVAIEGLKIRILMRENTNLQSYYYNGQEYSGITIGSYVGIQRGFNKIICRVEKEYLQDNNKEPYDQEYAPNRFIRYIEVSVVGNLYGNDFNFGIKRFPMIFDNVILLTTDEITKVLSKGSSVSSNNTINIGVSVSNNVKINIAWDHLFNTHIGIFGNTGSGKSNTLAKVYTELFNLEGNTIKPNFDNNSKFVVIDFNGEYLADGILRNQKRKIDLSTRTDNGDKLKLAPKTFWDIETLSILYSATEKTQKPFLKSAIDFYLDKDKYDITTEKIIKGFGTAYKNVFECNNDKNMLTLLRNALNVCGFEYDYKNPVINGLSFLDSKWHSQSKSFYIGSGNNRNFVSDWEKDNHIIYKNQFINYLEDKYTEAISILPITKKLEIIVDLEMIYYLAYGKSNFEFINPLIQRIHSRSSFIEKTIQLDDFTGDDNMVLTVISLKKCNAEAKKMIPLLVAKNLYREHKERYSESKKIEKTINLIIDEAHNILSAQSIREEQAWKDYRLEVFEEIIKEGRKFGFYITLASQRPYDISQTIISQLHNYFIHRLVNEQDLNMIANTVNSLDSVSKSQIPNLAPGQCIITGTSFDIPLLIQVDRLKEEKTPTSDSADLVTLWKLEKKGS